MNAFTESNQNAYHLLQGIPKTLKIKWITGEFSDRSTEVAFRSSYYETSIRGTSRLMWIFVLIIFTIFPVIDYLVIPESMPMNLIIRYGGLHPVLLFGLWASYKSWYRAWHNGLALFVMMIIAATITIVGLISDSPGRELYLATVCALPLVCGAIRLNVRQTIIFTLFTAFFLIVLGLSFTLSTKTLIFLALDELVMSVIGVVGSRTVEDGERTGFLQRQVIEVEHKRVEQLLLNILPQQIAIKLSQGEELIADNYNDVSVLFADIVGFTPLSSSLKPRKLINLLNTIFSEFDRLSEKYGVEKIKTIGDAYMVAAGLPNPISNPAEVLAESAERQGLTLMLENEAGYCPVRINEPAV